MSLFANSNESLVRSIDRRVKLVRSLTTGENFEIDRRLSQRIPQDTSSSSSSKKPRTITWSGSSPMRGFDLQESVALKSQQLQTRSHLIIKLKPAYGDANPRKVEHSPDPLSLPFLSFIVCCRSTGQKNICMSLGMNLN
jgi:hypothetical protein